MVHAFAYLLGRHPAVSIWSRRDEEAGKATLEDMVTDAFCVIFCLPVVAHAVVATRHLRNLAQPVRPHYKASFLCSPVPTCICNQRGTTSVSAGQ